MGGEKLAPGAQAIIDKDHPRVGGEKLDSFQITLGSLGSPPRGRGKELPFVSFEPHTGITPAWAGKSYIFGPLRPGSWDHPRVGGEKTKKIP